jgi:hypothetical protein
VAKPDNHDGKGKTTRTIRSRAGCTGVCSNGRPSDGAARRRAQFGLWPCRVLHLLDQLHLRPARPQFPVAGRLDAEPLSAGGTAPAPRNLVPQLANGTADLRTCRSRRRRCFSPRRYSCSAPQDCDVAAGGAFRAAQRPDAVLYHRCSSPIRRSSVSPCTLPANRPDSEKAERPRAHITTVLGRRVFIDSTSRPMSSVVKARAL